MTLLSEKDVKNQFAALGVKAGSRIAVAVSGGADSVALMLLAMNTFEITALTVDHGLRPESALEAEKVAGQCRDLGINHVTLRWNEEKPTANIQAAAREARYRLMAEWCRSNEIEYIAVAHHQDDQAETVLLRLARGSGVYGLAGMATTRDMEGVTLVRPLLTFPKAALVDYLSNRSVRWIEDPSNQSDAYDRVKIRRLLENPPVDGLRKDRLAATAARLRRSRNALEHYEAKWLYRAAEVFDEGYAVLRLCELDGEPEDILLRGLASLCRFVGKGMYVPRMEKLQRLFQQLKNDDFRGQTLYGAQFTPFSEGKILISRELDDCEVQTSLKETCTWDNRFEIFAKGDIAGLEICALGQEGWQQLKASAFDVEGSAVPRLVALALPAVFKRADLQAVPHLGYSINEGLRVKIAHKRAILTKK